ncbi:MAG: ATP-dependent helicase, partial [Proteobacteria bacterium]
PKFRWLIEQLESIKQNRPDEKVLVFTVWTAMQDLLNKACDSHFGLRTKVVNGATNQLGEEHVQNIIEDFSNSAGFNVLILSPLAAGAGLNITAANHVIHYGRWWNPAKEDQASGRAHRIKQTKDVHIHYPIMHHPDRPDQGFDVKLHLLVEKKRKLSTDFLTPYESDISAEELTALKETT